MTSVDPGPGPDIIGLFEGYGALTAAVLAALGGQLVAYSEIEPAACAVLAHHNPGVPNLGDITAVDWATVARQPGRPLVVAGGFPCTDVSSAGRRLGLHPGTRSGLWQHMAYAIAQLRPNLVVIENVRGLLTARGAEPTDELLAAWAARDKARRVLALIESKLRRAQREGNTEHVHRHQRDRVRFVGRVRQAVAAAKRADAVIVRAIGAVLGDLADLGFDAEWVGLRAADVGAPHGRFRVFILAWPAQSSADATGIGRGPARGDDGLRAPGLVEGAAADAGGGELQRRRDGRELAGTEGAGTGEGPQRQRDRHATGDGGATAADAQGVGRGKGRPEPAGVVGGPDVAVGGGAPAAAAERGGRPAGVDGHPARRAGSAAGSGEADRQQPGAGAGAAVADPDGGGLGPHVADDAPGQPDAAGGAAADADDAGPQGAVGAAGHGPGADGHTATERGGRGGSAAADPPGGGDPDQPVVGAAAGLNGGAVTGAGRGDRPGGTAAGVHDMGRAATELAWGPYEPAIRRWELILGRPAPAPTQAGRKGGQQLSPRFVEWLMGLPEGHVTAVPGISRNAQLKMLGNGVVPQQAEAALRYLLAVAASGEVAA